MILASKARKQSQTNSNILINQELQKIEKSIKTAITNGEFHIYVRPSISPKAKQILEKSGYTVQNYEQYNEMHTEIKW